MIRIIVKLWIVSLFLSPFLSRAHALGELFEIYDSPQGLSMGNALSADASGYQSHFYNPAGLAKMYKSKPEIVVVDFESIFGMGGVGTTLGARSLGIAKMMPTIMENPGRYSFFRLSAVPGLSFRGFSVAFLASYQFASLATSSTEVDLNSHLDLGPTVGFARNFAGNLFKLGVSATWLIRNELKGSYDPSTLTDETQVESQMREGQGLVVNTGATLTLPNRFLPTVALVWKQALNTQFSQSHWLNAASTAAPDPIDQSVNAAFSVHPALGKGLRSTIAFEVKHLLQNDIPLRKRTHIGFQLEDEKTFYVWLGLNQLYPTAGFALRVKGGNLELGTAGIDIGEGTQIQQDRRIFLRYTISF